MWYLDLQRSNIIYIIQFILSRQIEWYILFLFKLDHWMSRYYILNWLIHFFWRSISNEKLIDKYESVTLECNILTSSDPIWAKIPLFDLARLDKSNGSIFAQIEPLDVELLCSKVTNLLYLGHESLWTYNTWYRCSTNIYKDINDQHL